MLGISIRNIAKLFLYALITVGLPACDPEPASGGAEVEQGDRVLREAFDRRANDTWVEASGRVIRLLSDDHEGARHQRFIVQTGSGQTVLIAHNIDVAPRIPVGMGDRVRFRGVYEWNDLGGVIHWTHHDPRGEIEGGYVEFRRKRYR